MIAFAIKSSAQQMLTLNEIYVWFEENYPYFKTAPPGWKVCGKECWSFLALRNLLNRFAELDPSQPVIEPWLRKNSETST